MEIHGDVIRFHAENERLKAENQRLREQAEQAEQRRLEEHEKAVKWLDKGLDQDDEITRLRDRAERAEAARARLIGLHVRESSQGWDLLVSDCSTRLGFAWLRGFESREFAVKYLLHDLGLNAEPEEQP